LILRREAALGADNDKAVDTATDAFDVPRREAAHV